MGNFQPKFSKQDINLHSNQQKFDKSHIYSEQVDSIQTSSHILVVKEHKEGRVIYEGKNDELICTNCFPHILKDPIYVIYSPETGHFEIPLEELSLYDYFQSFHKNDYEIYLKKYFKNDFLKGVMIEKINFDNLASTLDISFKQNCLKLGEFKIMIKSLKLSYEFGIYDEIYYNVENEYFSFINSSSITHNFKIFLKSRNINQFNR